MGQEKDDRLEKKIVPALRAGFVVLTDRYIYSLMARAIVRGVDPAWVRNAYSFALKPDAVFYLRIGVDDLIPRVVFSRGFDYWESGMDLHPSEDMYESFRKYQTSLLAQFDTLAQEYAFDVIDATADIRSVFDALRTGISRVLTGEPREPLFSVPRPKPAEEPAAAPQGEAAAPAHGESARDEPARGEIARGEPASAPGAAHEGGLKGEKMAAQAAMKAADGEEIT